MRKNTTIILGLLIVFKASFAQTSSTDFVLSAPGHITTLFTGNEEKEVVHVAANALADDIQNITGHRPLLTSDTNKLKGSVVIIGTPANPLVQSFYKKYDLPDIKNEWEHFFIRVLNNKHSSRKVLLITGSDARGAAYGAFTISQLIGVSPWTWWADVTPHKSSKIILDGNLDIEQGPSVRYRGIFLNDEDWGLRPWASKTFEPEVGNIGPKTYAKIFELLLRMKANTIWPAMHPTGSGTIPFLEVKGNEAMAQKYDIVVGTAHNEPMMTNIPVVWDRKKMGAFNYITNKEAILGLWTKKIKQARGGDNIYTLGMRGVGDTKMEGTSSIEQQVKLMSRIFKDQRDLIKKYINTDITKVPQVFVPYKEVLPIYDHGLKVPEDVTLMWPDDNYGYIRRLSNKKERQRSGSAGIYYHLSYWGRPHDYLWLSSTQPGLIWEEMKKAWDFGAKRMWIANVGDIKPAAYNIQLFMDMAWDIDSIRPGNLRQHMRLWAARTFGPQNAEAVTKIMDEYYRLAFIRRPEFMGWSQTEPTTPTKSTAFRPFLNGDEIARRVEAYKRLISETNQIEKNIPEDRREAYFELVGYPVKGAAYMNEKFLYAQKSRLYAKYNLPAANDYAHLSRKAYDSIKAITDKYNTELSGGKWKYMMNRAPRDLPVFQLPKLPGKVHSNQKGMLVWTEGQEQPLDSLSHNSLPRFNPYTAKQHFIALFNKGTDDLKWTAKTDENWIRLKPSSGMLHTEDRITVSIDWDKKPSSAREGTLTLHTRDTVYRIVVPVAPPVKGSLPANPVVEQDGHVFIQAYDFIKKRDYSQTHQWTAIQQLGYTDRAYTILPIPKENGKGLDEAYLEYRFYTYSKGPSTVTVFTLPTHPVNDSADVRIALSIDNKKKQVVSYKTVGRSKEWKQNVLSNHARCVFRYNFKEPGWHTLKIYPLDPGVILDQIMISFKPDQKIYAMPVQNNW